MPVTEGQHVYVLIEHTDYDGGTVRGCASSVERAKLLVNLGEFQLDQCSVYRLRVGDAGEGREMAVTYMHENLPPHNRQKDREWRWKDIRYDDHGRRVDEHGQVLDDDGQPLRNR